MARSMALLSLLREAHAMEIDESRRQAEYVRQLQLFVRADDYVHIYRLSKELIEELEHDLIPHLLNRTENRRGLSCKIKILCALSFFANGSYQKIVSKNISTYMSQASTSRCINMMVAVLSEPYFVKKYIRFPQTAAERQQFKERFYEKFQIPGVIGSIDGTFVSMIRPKDNEERYYCRKGYHARNVQVVVDADLNIIHVDPSFGGATHDSFIFNYGELKSHLESLSNSGEVVCLLGDSAYPQREYMMTPVADARNGSPEEYYNRVHATARNTVERAFSLLKGRFRCLLVHRVLHYNPDTVAKIVIACCVLHNICNRAGLPAPNLNQNELNMERLFVEEARRDHRVEQSAQADLAAGRLARYQVIMQLWRSRNRIN